MVPLVEVWAFRKFDIGRGAYVPSRSKASLDTIEGLGAEAVEGSMELVDASALDGDGLYTPPALARTPDVRRRLERLKATYESIVYDERREQLDGWQARAEAVMRLVREVDDKLLLAKR
jgi:hypothetical protein